MPSLRRTGDQIGDDIFWGLALGLGMAMLCSIAAVGVYLRRGAAPFDQYGITLVTALGAYWVGGAVGGAVLGLLRPLTRSRVGAVFAGIVVAIPVATAIAVALDDISWTTIFIWSVIFGTIGGIAFSGFDRTPAEWDAIDQRVDEIEAHVARLRRARERQRARRRPVNNGGDESAGPNAV